jgi:NAD(P)-dependent dehydrogenase (short-subunit alcohol dehydrogenase family)
MKTILITGCSSGFGLEIARYFLERDWKVIATMRTPREDILPRSENLRVLSLDVTDPESIHHAVESAGPIDVLVNNAGIGFLNAVEGTPMETAREIFETNTLGTIAMTHGRAAAVPPTQGRCRRERHIERDSQAAAPALRLHRQQGSGERLH